jgi:hypothetical protein
MIRRRDFIRLFGGTSFVRPIFGIIIFGVGTVIGASWQVAAAFLNEHFASSQSSSFNYLPLRAGDKR